MLPVSLLVIMLVCCPGMARMRKITVEVPDDLLKQAQKAADAGVTDTVREALELLARRKAYRQLEKLRGTFRFSLDLDELRRDRT